MSTKKFGEVTFRACPQDHEPRHVHGSVGKTRVIVNLLKNGTVDLAERGDSVRPGNAKKSDVKKVLKSAAENFTELVKLWDKMHA